MAKKFAVIIPALLVCGGLLYVLNVFVTNLDTDTSPSFSPYERVRPEDCLRGYSESMSAEEVSQLLNTPLVMLTDIPDDILEVPNVQPYHVSAIEICGLQITYQSNSDGSLAAMVFAHRSNVSLGASSEQMCTEVADGDTSHKIEIIGCDIYQGSEENLETTCAANIGTSQDTLSITVSTSFSEEVTRENVCKMHIWDSE